ncbi:hypothetical protein [Alterisphingorhabdus coralli]|uniref:Uncharacterized protein n=1 Tax=Alterisphingorhabdus coralli TaxID=3071408 RepID=A0AA97FB97_9SPHN|nr:hypothetical protein [Parasphingorhabdus sp. SCSIO 66989]WOE76467.1 hypothetical protein RB602_07070 [Parasphingorhabdus sp. SCSIO 66989]
MSRQLTLSVVLSSLMMLGFVLAQEPAPGALAASGGGGSLISVTSGY